MVIRFEPPSRNRHVRHLLSAVSNDHITFGYQLSPTDLRYHPVHVGPWLGAGALPAARIPGAGWRISLPPRRPADQRRVTAGITDAGHRPVRPWLRAARCPQTPPRRLGGWGSATTRA